MDILTNEEEASRLRRASDFIVIWTLLFVVFHFILEISFTPGALLLSTVISLGLTFAISAVIFRYLKNA